MLWEHSITQRKVEKNYKRIQQKYERIEFAKEFLRSIKVDTAELKIKRDILVRSKYGEYKKSYRLWTPREQLWIQKNKDTKPSILFEIFNAVFKEPRTKQSIIGKRRNIK